MHEAFCAFQRAINLGTSYTDVDLPIREQLRISGAYDVDKCIGCCQSILEVEPISSDAAVRLAKALIERAFRDSPDGIPNDLKSLIKFENDLNSSILDLEKALFYAELSDSLKSTWEAKGVRKHARMVLTHFLDMFVAILRRQIVYLGHEDRPTKEAELHCRRKLQGYAERLLEEDPKNKQAAKTWRESKEEIDSLNSTSGSTS